MASRNDPECPSTKVVYRPTKSNPTFVEIQTSGDDFLKEIAMVFNLFGKKKKISIKITKVTSNLPLYFHEDQKVEFSNSDGKSSFPQKIILFGKNIQFFPTVYATFFLKIEGFYYEFTASRVIPDEISEESDDEEQSHDSSKEINNEEKTRD